jgi:alpha-glucosidase
MPYIYTLAEEISRDGMPLMRPLFLEFPNVDLDPGNEFMWGPSILVAPAMFGEEPQNYSAKVPAGDWYDYWTGKKIAGKAPGGDPVITGAAKGPAAVIEVSIKPALAELPVFVRGGSIIPLQPLVQSTSERPKGASRTASHVTLDGKPVSGSKYDAAGGVLRIRIPEPAGGGELRVKSK